MRRSLIRPVALAFLLGCAIAAGLLLLQSTEAANCTQIEKLKATVHQVLVQSARSLGQPGSAGYAYYVAHPHELSQARTATLAEAAQFAPRPCS